MNNDKTKVVWFGSNQPSDTTYLPHLNFDWNPEKFTVLGVEFTTNLEEITDRNIMKKITEMRKELNSWSKCDLTPFGKITVLKTLIVSKIIHLLTSLPSPSPKLMKEIETMFYSFLWNNKPDKVKRNITRQKLINSGLGMLDVDKFEKSLKLTWIRRFFTSQAKWKTIIENKYPKLQEILHFGEKFRDFILQSIKIHF